VKYLSGTATDMSIPYIGQFIDEDGLTKVSTAAEDRLAEIERGFTDQIEKLKKDLEAERNLRKKERQMCMSLRKLLNDQSSPNSLQFSDHHTDTLSLPGSVGGDRSALSSLSNDEDWEKVMLDDAAPVKWIPDHASPNCAFCGAPFGVMVRKHHCRRCGDVFCGSCSDHHISIPQENFYDPVRVCNSCFTSELIAGGYRQLVTSSTISVGGGVDEGSRAPFGPS